MILNPFGTGGVNLKNVVTYPDYIQVEVAEEYQNTRHKIVTIKCDANRKKTTIFTVGLNFGNGLTGNPYFAVTFLPNGKYIVAPYGSDPGIQSYSVTNGKNEGEITIDIMGGNYNKSLPDYDIYIVVAYEM